MNNNENINVDDSPVSPPCYPPYTGQCLCGEIQYSVDALEAKMGHCHCSMCRKFHGAAFATFGEARAENFHWLSGESLLKAYRAPNGTQRKFCSACGSSLIFEEANTSGEIVEFSLGTLDAPIPSAPDVHIFVGSKASWYSVNDDLPCFSEGRDSQREK